MKFTKLFSVISTCLIMLFPTMSVNANNLPTKAYICGEIGSSAVWNADNATIGSTVAEINGDAQYEVEWKVGADGGTKELTFLTLSIPNITSDSYPDININVTAVYIDGVKANYTMSQNAINTAYYEAGRVPETRVYLYDGLKGTNVADLPKLTEIKDSIKVVFTVTGTGQFGTSNIQENIFVQTEEATISTAETTTVSVSSVDSTITGDSGNPLILIIASLGLVATAGTAILSRVKFKKL